MKDAIDSQQYNGYSPSIGKPANNGSKTNPLRHINKGDFNSCRPTDAWDAYWVKANHISMMHETFVISFNFVTQFLFLRVLRQDIWGAGRRWPTFTAPQRLHWQRRWPPPHPPPPIIQAYVQIKIHLTLFWRLCSLSLPYRMWFWPAGAVRPLTWQSVFCVTQGTTSWSRARVSPYIRLLLFQWASRSNSTTCW